MEETVIAVQQKKCVEVQEDSKMPCDLVVSTGKVPGTPEFASQAKTSVVTEM